MDNKWQEQRDIRTDSCSGVNNNYKTAVVAMVLSKQVSERRLWLMAYLAVIQLARWCRHIVIVGGNTQNLLLGNDTASLGELLQTEVLRADPDCQVSNVQQLAVEPTLCLCIGTPDLTPQQPYVVIDARGWVAGCSFNTPLQMGMATNGNNEMGAAFAACLGNAELFRYLIGSHSAPYAKWYSLWTRETYEILPPQLSYGQDYTALRMGKIHIVGCGAIGSSFTVLFSLTQCLGEFLLVDPDTVEGHNTSSSLLFGYQDAERVRKKVDVCRDHLVQHGLAAEVVDADYRAVEYSFTPALDTPDIVLCFANENNIWSTIQNRYPPLCFHATTSKSWGIHVGRHIPLKENCLMCTFQDILETKFKPICSEVDIPQESSDESHTAILPFLSAAAATVTLAELIKTCIGNMKKENSVIFNLATSEGIFIEDYQPFGGCFICEKQRLLYSKFASDSKYWHLS